MGTFSSREINFSKSLKYLLTVFFSLILIVSLSSTTHAKTTGNYNVLSGTDASIATPAQLTDADITSLSAKDGNRMTSDGFWPTNDAYDESQYIEFVFLPNISASATIISIEVNNVYQRRGNLTAAKLEFFSNSTLVSSSTLPIGASSIDVISKIDIISYFNSPTLINGLKIRFLAYTGDSADRTSTRHDFIGLTVVYQLPLGVADRTLATNRNTATITRLTLVDLNATQDPVVYSIVSPPSNGSALLKGSGSSTLTYTPNFNYTGIDSLTYRATDGTAVSNTATTTINIANINNTPVISPISDKSIDEQTLLTFQAEAVDADSDSLTFSLLSNTTTTEARVNATTGVFKWTPKEREGPGTYSFTITAEDPYSASSSASFTVTVNEVNVPPVIENITLITDKNQATTTRLNETDPDKPNNTITFSTTSNPQYGAVEISGKKLTYTPNFNFYGTDSFNYQAFDGAAYSNTATATITVNNKNYSPSIQPISVQTIDQYSTLTLIASATDPDGDTITFSLTSITTSTTATISATSGTFAWTPNQAEIYGTFRFAITATDPSSASATETFRVIVNQVILPPTIEDLSITTDKNQATTTTLVATDPNYPALSITFATATNPQYGTVKITNSKLKYTPNTNYYGADSLTYIATNGTATSSPKTISITVNYINYAPVAASSSVSVDENSSTTITFSATDIDSTVLSYATATNPSNGTLSQLSGNMVVYTPNTNFYGEDSFRFRVSDSTSTDAAKIFITVNPVFVPISLNSISNKNVDELTQLTFDASNRVVNPNNVPISFTLTPTSTTPTSTGAVIGANTGVFSWTPTEAQGPGFYYFVITAIGGTTTYTNSTSSDWKEFRVRVNEVNVEPTAQAIATTTAQDASTTIILIGNDSDIPAQTLTYSITNPPDNGAAELNGNIVTYTPNLYFYGTDSFKYKVSDGTATSTAARVTITVTNSNNAPPVTSSTTVNATVDNPITIKVPATDPDTPESGLAVSIITAPTLGTITATSGLNVSYKPTGQDGIDTFTFKVSDGKNESNVATTTIKLSAGALTQITISANPTSLPAGSTSIITVIGKDKYGNRVKSDDTSQIELRADKEVSFGSPLLTFKNGRATTSLTRSSPGTVNVIAIKEGLPKVSVAVTFTLDDSAILKVTNIGATKTYASADNTFDSGWQWIFEITAPTTETSLSMKFNDWLGSGTSTILAANNIRIYSEQSSNANSTSTAITIAGAGQYSSTMTLTGDLEPLTAGRQIKIYVEAKIPATSTAGAYSTMYGIRTQ